MRRLTVGQTVALSVGDTVADCQVVALTGGEAVLVPHEPKLAARLPAAGDGASLVFTQGDGIVMLRGAMYRGTSDDDLRFSERAARPSAALAGEQRRKAARLPITLPVTMRQLDADGAPFGDERRLVTSDISLGGFAVGTGAGAFSPGALIAFEIVLVSREVIAGTARVVRAGSETSGIRFEHIDAADRIRLVGFLAARRARTAVGRASVRTA